MLTTPVTSQASLGLRRAFAALFFAFSLFFFCDCGRDPKKSQEAIPDGSSSENSVEKATESVLPETSLDAGNEAATEEVPKETSSESAPSEQVKESSVSPVSIKSVFGNCGGKIRDPGLNPNQVRTGQNPATDLHIATLQAPEALCNDGSKAVMYLRAGSGENADRWAFHLQGGSGCSNFEECEIRWCGKDYYDISKMSTSWGFGAGGKLPTRMEGKGINSSSKDNLFATWNHVYLYYCTSDFWTGQGIATYKSADGSRTVTMQRRGHQIIDAAITALRSPLSSDDSEVQMPSISKASVLLFNGTSAGSVGVQHNADWFAKQFALSQTKVFAAFDAAYWISHRVIPKALLASIETTFKEGFERRKNDEVPPPFMDESCQAQNNSNGELFRCSNPTFFTSDHITTPFFVRQDLSDPTMFSGIYQPLGLTLSQYTQYTKLTLESLATFRQNAIEGSKIARDPSSFGPDCKQHVGFESSVFFTHRLKKGTTETSAHDALHAWITGTDGHLIHGVDAASSICTGSDPDR